MKNRVGRLLLLWMFLTLMCGASMFGQGYQAQIVGRIIDPSGAPIPGATITATNVATNISSSTVTTQNGEYVIPQLPLGAYAVTVEAKGFQKFVRHGITLEVNQIVRVDATLAVGQVSQEVTVTAQSPVINTETSALGKVVNNREINDIPLNGRNYLSLALLTPGVVAASAGSNPDVINGSRPDHVSYLLDGAPNIDRRGNVPVVTPSLDAIQEYQILTNSYSAAYGRLGAGIVSVALKTGTNQFHGTVYDYLRNDALDARGFFDQQVPILKRNQFGASLGGPIIKDKAFFFFSYEGLRQRNSTSNLMRVPTLAERQGIFASPIRNPFTGKPYANNTIPTIDPVAQNILPFIPTPNLSGVLNYIDVGNASQDTDSYLSVIDYHFNNMDQLTGHFALTNANGTNPFRAENIPGFGSTVFNRNQQWSISETHIFSPMILNQFRAGFTRSNFSETSVNFGKNTSAQVGIAGVPGGYGLTSIVISGLPTVGDAIFLPDQWTDNEYSFSDSVNWTKGSHAIQFGVDFQRSQHFNLFAAYANGQAAFIGYFTGNAFADFLLGLPVQTQRQVGTNKSYLFSNYVGAYIQDDWKVLPNLTLNLGVRYDLNGAPTEKYNHWSNFIPSLGQSITAGTPGYPDGLMETHYNNFSPRVGFAYRPSRFKNTVIRGGYGIFTSFDLQYTLYQLLGATAYPFTDLQLYQSLKPGPLTLAAPFPSTPGSAPGASSPNGWEYNNPTPYTQNWNLTIGQDFGHNMGIEVSYVGNKGTHESVLLNMNQAIRTATGSISPYPKLGRVLVENLGANSIYNALQISFKKRFSGGLGFRSNFTWSKAIDEASFGASEYPQDPRNLAAERGLSDANRGKVWTSDFIYELPVGRDRRFGSHFNRGVDALLGGWQVNGILNFSDGRPFTPVLSKTNAQAGQPTRPNRIASGFVSNPTITEWFDPAAFPNVPLTALQYGNSGRNILVGPGIISVDTSLFKDFAMPWEGQRLQFRAEFFNMLNHANFGQPDPRVDQATAGYISSAGPGRQIQLALKYIF